MEYTCVPKRFLQEKPKPLLSGPLAIPAMPHRETLTILVRSSQAGLQDCMLPEGLREEGGSERGP